MAPRQPKVKVSADDPSATPSPLKPKTEKAKVEKVKCDKPRAPKVIKPKVTKTKAGITTTSDDEAMENDEPPAIKPPPKPKAAASAKKPTDKDASTAKDINGKEGKEKGKAVNGQEAIEVMMKYLKEQNRPYSATEISGNLHGKVTKTVADKLLKEMDASGLIMAKATNGTNKGSQWVFWAKQVCLYFCVCLKLVNRLADSSRCCIARRACSYGSFDCFDQRRSSCIESRTQECHAQALSSSIGSHHISIGHYCRFVTSREQRKAGQATWAYEW